MFWNTTLLYQGPLSSIAFISQLEVFDENGAKAIGE